MNDKTQIMIVEDDPDLSEMLVNYFRVQGYDVLTAAWGEDAVRLTKEHSPNLVVLDIRLPDIDGYEVCRRLRTTRKTQEIPVIFLTEKRDRVDKLHGLELGVVDYITKPFDIQELRLRVRNVLKRAEQAPLVNSVTNLPEGPLVEEKLRDLSMTKLPWGALSLSISGLDQFREEYGFVNTDDVLRAVTLMMNNAIREVGNENDFLGHISASHFLLVSDPLKLPNIRQRVENRIRQSMEYFYPLKDRAKAHEETAKGHLHLVVTQILSTDKAFENLDALTEAINKGHETSKESETGKK